MNMPPAEKTIIPPENGWKEQSYYIVEASFSESNPVHRYIFFTGFLNGKDLTPGGYSEFYGTEGEPYKTVYYLKALNYIGYNHSNEGATLGDKP